MKPELEESTELVNDESTIFSESLEFRGEVDSSFCSDLHSASFSSTSVLRAKLDIDIFYRTPCSVSSRFSRRSSYAHPDIDHLSKLHEHLLIRIFWHLNKTDLVSIMRTCRRFSRIGEYPTLWEFMNLGNRIVDELSLHILLNRRTNHLRLSCAQIMDCFKVKATQPALCFYNLDNFNECHLTHLDLSQTMFSDQHSLHRLLSRCTKLRALSLENCNMINTQILEAISNNKDLSVLDLTNTKLLTEFGLGGMLSRLTKLVEINFAWAQIERDSLKIICSVLPVTLRRLNLSGFREEHKLSDQNVATLFRTCPNLEELDLSDNPELTEKTLDSIIIAGQSRKLHVLTLSRCYNIEPIRFITLGFLQVLNVYGCVTSDGVEVLQNRLSKTFINRSPIGTIAKPTVGEHLTSIWGKQTRDIY